ncbi:hypothetical protein BXU08_06745 [Sphingomonas sp. LM7]|nr:hypothetical protein BXU08_06745 [Sphingomonas sp. LM7]
MERAFELARGSSCRDIEEIRRKLTAENFSNVDAHLGGTTVRKQLRALIEQRATAEVPNAIEEPGRP